MKIINVHIGMLKFKKRQFPLPQLLVPWKNNSIILWKYIEVLYCAIVAWQLISWSEGKCSNHNCRLATTAPATAHKKVKVCRQQRVIASKLNNAPIKNKSPRSVIKNRWIIQSGQGISPTLYCKYTAVAKTKTQREKTNKSVQRVTDKCINESLPLNWGLL